MLLVNKSIKTQVKSQLPWFINQEYPLFVKFLEYYYEWLEVLDFEHQYGLQAIIDNFKNFKDIDKTLDELLPFFHSVYIRLLPEKNESNTRIFIKKIIELYKAKGTIRSIEFLVYIILGKKGLVYLPKNSLAKSSNTLYGNLYFLLATPNSNDDHQYFYDCQYSFITIDNEIFPVQYVNKVNNYFLITVNLDKKPIINNNIIYYNNSNIGIVNEILNSIDISNSDSGFKIGDIIKFYNNTSLSPALFKVDDVQYGTIDSYIIDQSGTNYKIGDRFVALDNIDFEAEVIKIGNNGEILEISIINNNFRIPELVKIIPISLTGSNCKIKWQSSTIGKIKSLKLLSSGLEVNSDTTLYSNKTGFDFIANFSLIGEIKDFYSTFNLLDKTKILQDNYYYQLFSYVVELENNNNKDLYNTLNNLIHPAGYKNFYCEIVSDILEINNSIEIQDKELEEYQNIFLLNLYIYSVLNNVFELTKYSNGEYIQSFFEYNLNDISLFDNYRTTTEQIILDIAQINELTLDDNNISLSESLDKISIH